MAHFRESFYSAEGVRYYYPYVLRPNYTHVYLRKQPDVNIHIKHTERVFLFTSAALFVFPGITYQILGLIYLVRANSGYSKSARNWFLLVISCDFLSNFLRVAELLLTKTFYWYDDDMRFVPNVYSFGTRFTLYLSRIYKPSHQYTAHFICKTVFAIMQVPFFMSPIALSISGLVRAYSVKFPLKAKAVLTKQIDWILMSLSAAMAIVLAIVYSILGFKYQFQNLMIHDFGDDYYYSECNFPVYHYTSSSKSKTLAAYIVMLVFSFGVCAANAVSAVAIIKVLYDAKKVRKSMSSQESSDNSAEVRATVMLLAMNILLILSFLVSRIFMISTSYRGALLYGNQVLIMKLEYSASLLLTLPYLLNSVFAVGLNRKFYNFFLPCVMQPPAYAAAAASSGSSRTKSDKSEAAV